MPNAKGDLSRLEYRHQWDNDLRAYLLELEKTKPVVFCGDLNVCHRPIDIARPEASINQRFKAGRDSPHRFATGDEWKEPTFIPVSF